MSRRGSVQQTPEEHASVPPSQFASRRTSIVDQEPTPGKRASAVGRTAASSRRSSAKPDASRRSSVMTEDLGSTVTTSRLSSALSGNDEVNGIGGSADVAGPGVVFMPFVVMDDLLDKLKLLNYDVEFQQEVKMKPLNRHYFAIQSNPGEQFYLFSVLASWLVRKTGKNFATPLEYDDPNSTIADIIDHARSMGISVDFPPSRLKQGCGEQVIYLLDRLADEALKVNTFSWERPLILPEEGAAEEEEDEEFIDEQEIVLDNEETIPEDSDEDEENVLNLEDLKALSAPGLESRLADIGGGQPEEIRESNTNADEWKLEVERVLPYLKVTIRNDMRDWRSHVDQMNTHHQGIDEGLTSTKQQLSKLHGDISKTLEKIGSREKYLNGQFEQMMTEFRSYQDQLSQARHEYSMASGGVNERKGKFRELSTRVDALKEEMERRGSSMTDGSPLVTIRKALSRIKQESQAMDVRIGVVEHALLQARLRDRSQMQRELQPQQIVVPSGLY
ncbi:unnamed protein product [Cyprideis torosa]|uniref:Uncharacterized protein n=1 Tax=Cyprideis torosa TaxID=163714 RepID=A0A7R8ZSE4_9CRUS|nr:unnamed protein product [Cyprideis torosa]CAG0895885.1 unnamed protein product [Cyprideis torosa]